MGSFQKKVSEPVDKLDLYNICLPYVPGLVVLESRQEKFNIENLFLIFKQDAILPSINH